MRPGLPPEQATGIDSPLPAQYVVGVTVTTGESSAVGVRWDLALIFTDAAEARSVLADAVARARALEEQVAGIDDLDPAGLALLLDEASTLAGLQEVFHEDFGYGALRLLADASDTEARDLVAECEANVGILRDGLRAVALAVGSRPGLAEVPELASYRHWLDHQASLASARLEPAAERAFAARAPGAAGAWGRLSQEILTAASVPFDAGEGEHPHGVVELRLLRLHADRDVRRRADEALLGIYEENLQVAAACLDAVIADRLGEDGCAAGATRWRRRSQSTRSMPHTVELLLSAVERNTEILARWYERKREALGVGQIERYDRIAPVGDPPPILWPDAVAATCEVFDGLSPRLGDIARGIFAEQQGRCRAPGGQGRLHLLRRIPGRAYGVFVFLSYIESASGATMVGHEMGHGVHFAAATAARPWLAAFEPATAAFFEVPSTFAELAVGGASLDDDRR